MQENIKKLQAYFAAEKKKIANLSFQQKVRYIIGYYWLWILGIGAALYLSGYMVYRGFFTPKDYWFYGMFANTMVNEGNGSQLWQDFVSFAEYDTRQKKVEINSASWFDPSVSGGTNNSYYQAFVAMVESGDLDVLVMGEEGLKGVGSSGRLLDLRDDRCSHLLEQYSDRIIYCDPYDTEYSGEPVPIGIDLSDSLLVTKYHLYEKECALGIGAYTKRPESVETFLRFALR